MAYRARRNLALCIVLAASPACLVAAQEPAGVEPPHFDAASIKVQSPRVPHIAGVRVLPGGKVEIDGFALKTLISTAFDLGFWQISGGDEWVSKELYSVEATPPDALRSSIKTIRYTLFGIEDALLRQMLQALLVDRFQLKFHRETKTVEVYLLKRNERPLALQPARTTAESASFGSIGYDGGKWGLFSTTMSQLAWFASNAILRAPVFDRTELTGSFDYRQSQPSPESQNDSDQTSSFQEFLSKAGLTWERSQGMIDILVIDHASTPTPN